MIPFEPGGPVLVTDGGLATELEARGHDLSDALWSARLLMDAPGEITAAHLAFFRAGAVIATTASYQASFDGFAARGLDRAQAAGLMQRSVELARQARAELAGDGVTRWVAASVGPYGAALADGSEYRGRYGLSVAELTAWHRPRLEVLAQAGADVLALETVPDADEAEALLTAIAGLGLPGLADLQHRRRAHPGRAAPGRRLRAGRRRARGGGGGRELLRPGRRPRRHRDGRRGHRQAGDRVPEQRRGLGRRAAGLGRPVPVRRRRSPGSGWPPAPPSSAAAAASARPTSRRSPGPWPRRPSRSSGPRPAIR